MKNTFLVVGCLSRRTFSQLLIIKSYPKAIFFFNNLRTFFPLVLCVDLSMALGLQRSCEFNFLNQIKTWQALANI